MEVDTAQSLTKSKIKSIGQAVELDTALTLAAVQLTISITHSTNAFILPDLLFHTDTLVALDVLIAHTSDTTLAAAGILGTPSKKAVKGSARQVVPYPVPAREVQISPMTGTLGRPAPGSTTNPPNLVPEEET